MALTLTAHGGLVVAGGREDVVRIPHTGHVFVRHLVGRLALVARVRKVLGAVGEKVVPIARLGAANVRVLRQQGV